MTIATNNGVPIIQGGKIVTDCACCGGWSCYKKDNTCSSLLFQISSTIQSVRLTVTTESLEYTRTSTQTLSPAPSFNDAGCGLVIPLTGCSEAESTWSFASQNISGTLTLSRDTSVIAPGQVRYSAIADDVNVSYFARFQCVEGNLVLNMGATRFMPNALLADSPGCHDGSYVITGNGNIVAGVQVDLGTPAGFLCELFPNGISKSGPVGNEFSVLCYNQTGLPIPSPPFLKPAWDGAYYYQDLFKPGLLQTGTMSATLEFL